MRRVLLGLFSTLFLSSCGNPLGGSSLGSNFLVENSAVPTSISPTAWGLAGGTTLTITGNTFSATATVTVGGTNCSPVNLISPTELTCILPAHGGGVADVAITNPDAYAGTLSASFSYESFVYVGIQSSPGKIAAFVENPSTGALTAVAGSPFTVTGNNATYGAVVEPTNNYLYVANYSSANISAFAINSGTGVLSTTVPGTPFAAGANINGLAVDPSGRFLFGSNYGAATISGYTIGSNGALTAMAGSPFVAGTQPGGMIVTPNAKFLYAALNSGSGVSGYSINQGTGVLTPLAGSPFAGGAGDGIAVDPYGRFLYMGDGGGQDSVSAYTINSSTGVLTAVAGSPFSNGAFNTAGGNGVYVDPSGQFLYSTAYTAGDVTGFSINQSTGALTLLAGSPWAAGGGCNDVKVDPTGNYVYTSNSTGDNATAFLRNTATGNLTLISNSATGGSSGIIWVTR